MATIKSIKEKAKAYDEAIEKAKNCLKDGTITNTAISYIETIFPELIESEDERVRKELLSFFIERAKYTEDSTFNGLSSKEIISWLEKQGEHAKFRGSIQVGDKVTRNEDGVLVNLTQLNRVVNKGIENAIKAKQGEQKSAWSEEDEEMLNSFLHKLEVCDLLSIKECIWIKNKLKALKDRVQPQNTWKPSEKQMKQLGWVAEQNKNNMIGKELMTLYQDLKKLREG